MNLLLALMTYEQCREFALKENKPLIVLVGKASLLKEFDEQAFYIIYKTPDEFHGVKDGIIISKVIDGKLIWLKTLPITATVREVFTTLYPPKSVRAQQPIRIQQNC